MFVCVVSVVGISDALNMSKIRINELARQLEVKSREVIDKLHELGITEALTHSSSIDDENAEKLRRYFGGDTSALKRTPQKHETAAPAEEKTGQTPERQRGDVPKRSAAGASSTPVAGSAEAEGKTASGAPQAAPPVGAVDEQKPPVKEEAPADDLKPRAIPLRPPMLGRGAP